MKKLYVLKLGSSLLTNDDGRLNKKYLDKIASIIYKNVLSQGDEIIIVTSGAIATGVGLLNLSVKPKDISEKQALASIGQVELMNHYNKSFAKYNRIVGQVLLTKAQIDDRERYLNIKNTVFTLLKKGIIPIVNENDVVSISEIKFGDNDTLSALVAAKMKANELVILTDVDGVFTSNPRENKDAKLIKKIEIQNFKNLDIEFSSKSGTKRGTGGMVTKFKAAQIACFSGVEVFIANGKKPAVLKNLFQNYEIGTKFLPAEKFFNQKQSWLVFSAKIKGSISIDKGAELAVLEKGKSLLTAGITEIFGDFKEGDVVDVKASTDKIIAKGMVEFGSAELTKMIGKNTSELKILFGQNFKKVAIHRDNLVILSTDFL